ncbi:MAG: hypothetical protein NC131_16575 [Roseburia sp.]|nr:hypothetical protein [Roseburia sp.]
MVTLNLETKSNTQKRLKVFLEQNASKMLADKINNGVYIEKDGKRLLNKKYLDGFVKYATEQAKKEAAKGETGAFLEDDTVFGWLIHYYEEDSIEGKLYNEDGTEYKTFTKVKPVAPVKAEPQKPKAQQSSLFDMLSTPSEDDGEELNDDYTPEELEELENETNENDRKLKEKAAKPQDMSGIIKVNPLYERYLATQKQYADCVVFLHKGDFYEAFGDRAIAVAEPLDLAITGRDFGLKERVAMVCIPYHAFDNYLTKLIKSNFKIAVAEDIDDVTVFPQYDEEDIEELTEQQMREFDGYADEDTEELPTVSKILGTTENDEDDGCTELLDTEAAKAFDKEAVCILSDLFDGEITLA